MACVIGLFSCLVYFCIVWYLYKENQIKDVEWDFATCTLNDYSMKLRIKKAKYEDWYQNVFK
jgi:hypothetical protein